MKRKKSATQKKLRLNKVPFLAYLEPAQSDGLKALSERTRVPQQQYFREGVEMVLAKYRSKK